jgi:glycosyltransferase involved in cell wall biosynthesis
MQEIKKRRIVIASVLKPIDDTRMFEKIGSSLATFYKVDIIGYPSTKTPTGTAIDFHTLPSFHRLSFQRLLASARILFQTLKCRPDVFIITTHELLLTALVVKIFTSAKIIYDVQENYRRNILHTNAFPIVLRPVLACWVVAKEWFARLYVDHYLLAEEGYKRELVFPNGKFTVLENKFRKPEHTPVRTKSNDGVIRLLFSGTLNESTGVFTAIDLAEKLHAVSDAIRLMIIGYASQDEILNRIKSSIAGKNFITLIGGDRLVPHREIIEAIAQSDFGVISYPHNPATINSVPTKLYEYLGSKLPMLLIDHPVWTNLAAPYPAAVVFDPENLDVSKIISIMSEEKFFINEPVDIFWEDDTIVETVDNLLG